MAVGMRLKILFTTANLVCLFTESSTYKVAFCASPVEISTCSCEIIICDQLGRGGIYTKYTSNNTREFFAFVSRPVVSRIPVGDSEMLKVF